MIGPLSALVGTAALLAVWMALGALVFGLGMMVHRILRTPDAEIDAAITCWLGVAFACTVLLAWNFVAPINGVASSTLLIAGWGWCVATRRKFASACRAGVTTLGRTGLLIAIGYGMWLANHARGPLINWDSGAYHIQAVRWAEAFPAVPGLANLDYRLGHQSASFLYYAAMDAGPLRGQAHHFANGFCLLLLGVGSLIGIFRYFRADRGSVLELTIHASALTVAVSYVAVDDGVASFVTDIPATAVGFVMSSAFAAMVQRDAGELPPLPAARLPVILLAATGVALKLSLAPVAGIVILVSLWMVWTRPRPGFRSRDLVLAAALVALPVGLTVGRSVVIAGYPLSPSAVLPFPVDWRVPEDQARQEQRFIRAFGRLNVAEIGVNPNADDLSNWVPRWIAKQRTRPFHVAVPLAIAFVGGFALLVLRGRNGRWPLPPMVVLVTFALGVGVWWQSSPVSRFGVVPCWVLAAWVSSAWLQRLSTAKVQWVVASPVVLAFLCASVMSVENPTPRALVRGFVGGFTRDIRTKGWVDTSLRTTGFETYVTDSGARLNVIRTESGLCWDTPIPCTSTPSKNLELRDPTNLGRGFRIRGDWNPENWPTPALTSFRSTAR